MKKKERDGAECVTETGYKNSGRHEENERKAHSCECVFV